MSEGRELSTGAKVAAAVATLAMLAVMAGGSQWRISEPADEAMLRLSWRTEPVRVESCRELSAAEQADVPAHMRRAESCTGDYADYELRLNVDGRDIVVDTVAPSGLRRDRPVYVLHETVLQPGPHDVAVSFTALVPPDVDLGDVPLTWSLSERWILEPGRVSLVTLDDGGTEFTRR